MDLIWALCRDVAEDGDSYMEFDDGQVCRWLSGIARLSPVVTEYYGKNTNRRKLAQRIEKDILLCFDSVDSDCGGIRKKEFYESGVHAEAATDWFIYF